MDMQERLDILHQAARQGNGEPERRRRLELLKDLRNDVDGWVRTLEQRGRGPTPDELAAILERLNGGVLYRLQEVARPA